MNVAELLAPRTFAPPKKGEQRYCENCRQDFHAHKRVGCSGCGGEFRVCLICPEAQTGLSACDEHRRAVTG